jgi:hypothetical protein
MARKAPARPRRPEQRRRRTSYTAGEWFMVALGVALVILVIGMVISAVLEK